MKHRQRRIIYNNDGNDAHPGGVTSIDGWLARRYKPTLNTQVDSVFYCTGATVMVTHLTDVGETYGKYVTDPDGLVAVIAKGIDVLKEAGTDSLELATTFCHENNIEIFFSHRINDIHDTFDDEELCTWKREHPQYLMGSPENRNKFDGNDPRHWWSSMDFEEKPVRDLLLAMHEEILRKYDIDGIEIDYFRSPMFFRPNLTFEPATSQQVEILTDFQRRVRQLAYEAGNRRGRPILVASRVPVSIAACLHVGIDIEGWLQQDLIDVLTIAGGYVPFTTPTRQMIDLGHAYDVPVYPTISASGMRGIDGRYSSIESWRGAASNIWHNGPDGIVVFNTFPSEPQHPHFTDLGDPQKLAYLNKRFAIDNTACLEGDLRQGIVQTQILPVTLDEESSRRQVVLPVGDDVVGAEEAGRLSKLDFRVWYAQVMAGDQIQLRLNGNVIETTGPPSGEGWVTYKLTPSQLRHGDNTLRFDLVAGDNGNDQPVSVQAVELDVEYD